MTRPNAQPMPATTVRPRHTLPASAPVTLLAGISVVGFDAAAAVPYYIVRNTWGDAWGEQGYIRMKMGGNLCGLATYAYVATA